MYNLVVKKTLPEFLKPCFWDVDFENIDADKWPYFVISRVMDKGDTEAIKWLLAAYSKDEIKQSLLRVREMGRMTASFWAAVLSVNPEEVLCLQKPYTPIRFGLSS